MDQANPHCGHCGKLVPSGRGHRNLKSPEGQHPFCSKDCAEADYRNPDSYAEPGRILQPTEVRAFVHEHITWWLRIAPRYRDAWLAMVCHGWQWFQHPQRGWHALWPCEEGWVRWNFFDCYIPMKGFPSEQSLAYGWDRVGSPLARTDQHLPAYATSFAEIRQLEIELRQHGDEDEYMQALDQAMDETAEKNPAFASELVRSIAVLAVRLRHRNQAPPSYSGKKPAGSKKKACGKLKNTIE
jgi:hypothetical protein